MGELLVLSEIGNSMERTAGVGNGVRNDRFHGMRSKVRLINPVTQIKSVLINNRHRHSASISGHDKRQYQQQLEG